MPMSSAFTAQQRAAVRHAFSLAGYDADLRTLPEQPDGVIVFVVAPQSLAGDQRSLEIVLDQLLDRRTMVSYDIGSVTVPFEEKTTSWSSAPPTERQVPRV